MEWMKSKRDDPVARERPEIFTVTAERDIALVVDENFGACGWNGTPARIAALGRCKDCLLGKRIKDPDAGVGSKISGEKAEMKEWLAAGAQFKGAGEGGMIRATPVHAMMQSGGGGMQLAHDPAIFAAQNRTV